MTNIDLNPKVCIDSHTIRRIRESKKLTQFYVAKVVGVTTDTVSRWENNRYPTIRRDNALLLAEALEVDLVEILLHGTGEPASPDAVTGKKPKVRIIFSVIAVFCFVTIAYLFFMQRQPAPVDFSATRILPTYAVTEGTLPVRVQLDSSSQLSGMILREQFPQGWKLIQASPPPSSLDNVDGMVRWIIKPNDQPLLISYLLQVPPELKNGESYDFRGEVIINPIERGLTFSVSGDSQVVIGPFHWADKNGDSVIDDVETLTASNAIDDMEKLHLSWDVIEKIWDAGRYQWDAELKTFVPMRKE